MSKDKRDIGEFLTPEEIFKEFIFPSIKNKLYDYIWVDLFAGEGNLIIPILDDIDKESREDFFKNRIFLFDKQEEMVEKSIEKVVRNYDISRSIVEDNINQRDTIENYPSFLKEKEYPIYHITNPPFIYKGYISKNKRELLKYFEGDFEDYQDLYQLALMNDCNNGIKKCIYIIPTNFLFGDSSSCKIRNDFLKYYNIRKGKIIEDKIFKNTGKNVVICFFERKDNPKDEVINFEGIKITNDVVKDRNYSLKPENDYMAGDSFKEFTMKYKNSDPIKLNYYLKNEEVLDNKGSNKVKVIDTNDYKSNQYVRKVIEVNDFLKEKIDNNILFVRTLDTGGQDGRVGLYEIEKEYNVNGVLVSEETQRTRPIQIFFKEDIPIKKQKLLKNYFNTILEYYRKITDSEFLSTYKYSDADYTRKYLGLRQTRRLIQTFPKNNLTKEFEKNCKNKNSDKIISFLKKLSSKGDD